MDVDVFESGIVLEIPKTRAGCNGGILRECPLGGDDSWCTCCEMCFVQCENENVRMKQQEIRRLDREAKVAVCKTVLRRFESGSRLCGIIPRQ